MSLAEGLRLTLEGMGFEVPDEDDGALFDCMLKNGSDVGRAANAWMDAAGLPIVHNEFQGASSYTDAGRPVIPACFTAAAAAGSGTDRGKRQRTEPNLFQTETEPEQQLPGSAQLSSSSDGAVQLLGQLREGALLKGVEDLLNNLVLRDLPNKVWCTSIPALHDCSSQPFIYSSLKTPAPPPLPISPLGSHSQGGQGAAKCDQTS